MRDDIHSGRDWLATVSAELAAVWNRAVDELDANGLIDGAVSAAGQTIVQSGPVTADLVDVLLVDPAFESAIVASAGAIFVESAPAPEEPWPVVYFAALQVLYLWTFWRRARLVRRGMVQGRLDLQGLGELVWIATRIGALSEGFRPAYSEALALASEVTEARVRNNSAEVARKLGAETTKAKRKAWEERALAIAQAARAEDPGLNRTGVRDVIRAKFTTPALAEGAKGQVIKVSLPASDSTLYDAISRWEKIHRETDGEEGLAPCAQRQSDKA